MNLQEFSRLSHAYLIISSNTAIFCRCYLQILDMKSTTIAVLALDAFENIRSPDSILSSNLSTEAALSSFNVWSLSNRILIGNRSCCKISACESFLLLMRGFYFSGQSNLFWIRWSFFLIVIETKKLFCKGAWYHCSCCNIIKLRYHLLLHSVTYSVTLLPGPPEVFF